MIAELTAIKAHLALMANPVPVHLFEATGSTDTTVPAQVPYLVLGASGGLMPDHMPVAGVDQSLEFDLRLTSVAGVVDAPPKVASRVRDYLSPAYGVTRIALTGRALDVFYVRTEVASAVDRDVVVAGTNRHPAYGVDTYHVVSQPTA